MPQFQDEAKPWERLRQRAADPNAAAYVDPKTGQVEIHAKGGDDKALLARGLTAAKPEDIEKRASFLQNSTTENQTRAAIETGLSTATMGAVGGEEDFGTGAAERHAAFEEASPGLAMGARAVGSALPMLATGGAASAAGLGRTAIAAAEGVGAGLAEEAGDASFTGRELQAGNIALAGMGGALFGGAIPAVLKRGAKAAGGAADAAAAVAGEVGESIAPKLEAASTARAARDVVNLPPGPARDTVLRNGADQHLAKVTEEVTDVATRAGESMAKADIDRATLKRLMPQDSPVQTKWATDTAEELRGMAGARPVAAVPEAAAPAAPVNLAGKKLEDLKALPIEDAADRARVEALKANPDFAKSGRVASNDGAQGITLVDDGGELALRDGRHRLTAAQELGLESVHGRYVDGKTGKVLFEGDIPLKSAAPDSGIRPKLPSAEEVGFVPHSKTGKRSIKRYESDMRRIDNMTDAERVKFDSLVEEHAAVSRISPFGEGQGNAAKLYELRKDVLEEYGDLFPKRKASRAGGPVPSQQGVEYRSLNGPNGTPSLVPPPAAEAGHAGALRAAAESLLESKGGLDTVQRARQALVDLRAAGAPQEAIDAIQKGVTDKSLFGRAAEAIDDFERAKLPGNPLDGFDPSDLTPEARANMTAMAEALEDRAAARAKWDAGGGKDPVAARLLQDAKRIRAGLGLADDVAGARAREASTAAASAPKAAPTPGRETFGQAAAGEAAEWLAERALGTAIPGAGLALKAGRMLWNNIDANGQAAIKSAARNLARQGLEGAARGLETAGTVGAVSAVDYFTGDYPGPQEAFAARREMLTEMLRDPTVLPSAMAESFGDLPKTDPRLFEQLAGRMARATTYVTQNLPAGIATSLTHPRGIPPSSSTMRDFALVWNSAMHPETVIQDVANGTAVPSQIRALQTVDPDTYQNLLQSVTEEIGQNYEQTSSQTKQWCDILFQSDGIAGPAFSWRAAEFMTESMQNEKQGKPAQSSTAPLSKTQPPTASGLEAIRSGVTNRGGAS